MIIKGVIIEKYFPSVGIVFKEGDIVIYGPSLRARYKGRLMWAIEGRQDSTSCPPTLLQVELLHTPDEKNVIFMLYPELQGHCL